MTPPRIVREGKDVTTAWLGEVLGREVEAFHITPGHGQWSRQLQISARMGDGSVRALRLKICLGGVFGRSEVDYYTRDYVDMPDAPLVPCLAAEYDPAVGYHLLLEDLATSHTDRRDLQPTLAHGLAVAEALGRLHRHHWMSRPAPGEAVLGRYLDHIRPGLAPLERATGRSMRGAFERHEQAFRERWARPQGMTLLHGDLNPTNLLTPRGADAPVWFLDRQPFDWSLTYGLAVYDLAYFMIPWWPEALRKAHGRAILRCWYDALSQPEYAWSEAQADWRLCVGQCLNIPIEWCSRPSTLESMRWLWEAQLARIESAVRDGEA